MAPGGERRADKTSLSTLVSTNNDKSVDKQAHNFIKGSVKCRLLLLTLGVAVLIITQEMKRGYLRMTTDASTNYIESPSKAQTSRSSTTWLDSSIEHNGSSEVIHSEKWVVLDALVSPCPNVTIYTVQIAWTVIILTDKVRPIHGCWYPACLQMSLNMIQNVSSIYLKTKSNVKDMPPKLLVYLFAISKGAAAILDASCQDPQLAHIDKTLHLDVHRKHVLYYNATALFNPFQHAGYGRNFLPREYIDFFANFSQGDFSYENSQKYYIRNLKDVHIRQSVLPSKSTCFTPSYKEDILIDTATDQFGIGSSPVAVVTGPETFATVSTGPTLFLKDSFWWLYTPSYLSQDQLMLFRSLWIHKIKGLNFVNVGHYFSGSVESRDEQCQRILKENVRVNKMYAFINDLACDKSLSEFACGLNMAVAIVERMGLQKAERIADQLLQWVSFLELLDLKETQSQSPSNNVALSFQMKYCPHDRGQNVVRNHNNLPFQLNVVRPMLQVCPDTKRKTPDLSVMWQKAKLYDIALIIVINYAKLFGVIPYLEFIQRQAFRYIVYCGPNMDKFIRFSQTNGLYYVTYIEGLTGGWRFMYGCVTQVMKLGLPVKGYLQIGDDILLNTWMLQSLPRDQIWMPQGFLKTRLDNDIEYEKWYHWKTPVGKPAIMKAFEELLQVSNGTRLPNASSPSSSTSPSPSVSSLEFQTIAKNFVDNYTANLGLEFVIKRAMDIFYIPEVLKTEFIALSEFFRKHKVFIELALPIMHMGLVSSNHVSYISGASLWQKNRRQPWLFYNGSNSFFIHPFKSLNHLKTVEGRHFFYGRLPRSLCFFHPVTSITTVVLSVSFMPVFSKAVASSPSAYPKQGVLVAQRIVNPPCELHEPFCRGFELRHRYPGLAEGLKA
ncbi:hypothetical protein PoB_000591300 [Plakobranchus ocellatus]|uniref:Uncharacterized protein n=1 Tax=Plakobranchus ocellatus TaxID=259542 RepID=A0AAV3YAC7_9GAST|nr:hypothetical protein PoB_000591300 [Plakobranchus ocellatus]